MVGTLGANDVLGSHYDKIRPHDSTLPSAQPQNLVGQCDPFSPLLNGLCFIYLSFERSSVQAFALPDEFASLRPVCRARGVNRNLYRHDPPGARAGNATVRV